MQRAYASSIAGEMPPDQALPEVWVHGRRRSSSTARALLHELRHPPHRHWVCPGCRELIDGPFEQCWNCGAAMPACRRDERRPSRRASRFLLTLPPLLWAGNAVVGRALVGSVPPLTLNACAGGSRSLLLLPLGWRVLRDPRDIAARWKHLRCSACSAWAATTRCSTWRCRPARR